MALNFASILMERSATAVSGAVSSAYSAASRGMEGLGGTRQPEDGHSGLLAEPTDAVSREPSCSAPTESLIEGICFRETASEPGIAKSRLALLARDRFGTFDKDVVSSKPRKKLHKTWLFGKTTILGDVHQCAFNTKGVSGRKQDLSLWAFSLSKPSDKRGSSNQHSAVTIGFTDKLTADRWHAQAQEALCVFQQRDRPDLSAQSMSALQRGTFGRGLGHLRRASCPGLSDPAAERQRARQSASVDVLGGLSINEDEGMSDVPIMDLSKTAPNPSRHVNINASSGGGSRSLDNTAPSTPTFVQFATPFGSPVQQQSRSASPRTSWFGGAGEELGRSRFSVSETGERSKLKQAWRKVVAFVTCSKF